MKQNTLTVPWRTYSQSIFSVSPGSMGSGCLLSVGETYSLSMLDSSGGAVTNVRLRLAKEADCVIGGISPKFSGVTYTPLAQLVGEVVPDGADVTHECVLKLKEVMPKPTDDGDPGEREGMDVNGLESGWVEVENTSDKWADLADYRFIRVNRGKKTDPKGAGNFPTRLVPPRSLALFYTSERYANSKDRSVSAFAEGAFDGKPAVMGVEERSILVWGDKVNPKKSPYVRLYYAPGGTIESVVDTVVGPSDVPEGYSIVVGEAGDGEGTRRWLCPAPTHTFFR